jgi:hypothetical protein
MDKQEIGVHLSHCGFGENVGHCKYGDDEICPAVEAQTKAYFECLKINPSNPLAPAENIERLVDACTNLVNANAEQGIAFWGKAVSSILADIKKENANG